MTTAKATRPITERMTNIAMAIPFQFLWDGTAATSSCKKIDQSKSWIYVSNRKMASADSCFQKSSLVSRDLWFYFKKRPLCASFLVKGTEVAPSSQDLAKKNQFQISSWRNKPIGQRFITHITPLCTSRTTLFDFLCLISPLLFSVMQSKCCALKRKRAHRRFNTNAEHCQTRPLTNLRYVGSAIHFYIFLSDISLESLIFRIFLKICL